MNFLAPLWQDILGRELEKLYMGELFARLKADKQGYFPHKTEIFRAFNLCDFDAVRVVILGQDPYHTPGMANGLAFAVNDYVKIKPPSLLNIMKEVEMCFGKPIDRSKSSLVPWAVQGVFLLNTILTVAPGAPLSHKEWGWERFTDQAILELACRADPLVFMLWGSYARSKKHLLEGSKHLVLECNHPSPLSANKGAIEQRFVGCRHFLTANEWLQERGQHPITWTTTG